MLTQPPPPAAIQGAFDRQLTSFLRTGDPSPDARRGKPPAYQVFTLGLVPLSEGRKLEDNVTSVSWRFLINSSSGGGLYATVAARAGEQPKVTGVSRGPKAVIALQANQDLRKLRQADTNEQKYELRLLTVPGLLTEAFWMKWIPDDAEKDLIVPFFTSQKLVPMHAYSIDEFVGIAGPLAQARLRAEEGLRREAQRRNQDRRSVATNKRAQWQAKEKALNRPPACP
jgi:hypothetical protein